MISRRWQWTMFINSGGPRPQKCWTPAPGCAGMLSATTDKGSTLSRREIAYLEHRSKTPWVRWWCRGQRGRRTGQVLTTTNNIYPAGGVPEWGGAQLLGNFGDPAYPVDVERNCLEGAKCEETRDWGVTSTEAWVRSRLSASDLQDAWKLFLNRYIHLNAVISRTPTYGIKYSPLSGNIKEISTIREL